MAAPGPRNRGIPFALGSALLLGTTPIFGKQAISAGLPPLAVVAGRTLAAGALLLLLVLLIRRQYLHIYPLGLVGCLLAGGLNGAGSLLFDAGLARIDAGVGQLLYALYPIYVALFLYLDGQQPNPMTLVRLGLSLPAVALLTQASTSGVDPLGAVMMLAAGVLYGIHIPINQRVLYEVPAPTVTLYTLLAMAAVVTPAHLLISPPLDQPSPAALLALAALTAVTFFSRLLLFAGVKTIGGLRTAILGLAQLLVTVSLASLWLGETFSPGQWAGAGLLGAALLLVGREPVEAGRPRARGWLYWLRPPLASRAREEASRRERR